MMKKDVMNELLFADRDNMQRTTTFTFLDVAACEG
jgi:hypothetical protein